MTGPDTTTAGPLLAAAEPEVREAVFRFAVTPGDPWGPYRAAAAALADNGLAGPGGYGVVAYKWSAGHLVIERQDGGPLPKQAAPQWRKLVRLVREAIGPSPDGG